MTNENEFPREPDDTREALEAHLAAKFGAALAQMESQAEEELELGQTPPFAGHWWNIWATGPRQFPIWNPGRIIDAGQPALIHTVVWMNPLMCSAVTGFGAKIELNYYTSDTQNMVTVPALSHRCCIEAVAGQCYYNHYWWFTPEEAACLYETNICARICNCENKPVPQYSAYVKHVYDWDPEFIWPLVPPTGPHFHGPGWHYDHPIRFMVSDGSPCDCEDNPCQ